MMRIGELSRRTGVSPELLRAWEQRYGLLQPERSRGGFRLYSAEDEMRVRRTTALIADGMSAAEAARLASSQSPHAVGDDSSATQEVTAQLQQALEGFDSAGAHAALDRLFGTFSVRFALMEVLVPYLRDLGERWARGEITVAQEHFATQLVRGRVLALAGDWGVGGGSNAVLACLPREAHDLGLICFGLLLARHGWRVTFLGADTPLDTLEAGIHTLRPTLLVLATLDAGLFHDHAQEIRRLAASTPVAVAAPVDESSVVALGAEALPRTIDEAADSLATRRRPEGQRS
jgi:MerR family transcriptional regulator, light-induced transcriptional regulator